MGQEIKIRVENVCKIFGPNPAKAREHVRAGIGKAELLQATNHVLGLHDINLDIPAGQVFVIMGLSGSGKSTLIRHFNRLIEPTDGRILIDGQDILQLGTLDLRELRRRRISMVFQKFGLLPHRTVLDNVAYGRIVGGEPAAVARRKAAEFIGVVGLTGFESHLPSQLSGGHAAAGRAGPRAGHRCRDPADGRSVQRAGPADPHRDAGAVEGDPEPTGQDCGLHHP